MHVVFKDSLNEIFDPIFFNHENLPGPLTPASHVTFLNHIYQQDYLIDMFFVVSISSIFPLLNHSSRIFFQVITNDAKKR